MFNIKKIRFYTENKINKDSFVPARKTIPDWYKKIPLHHGNPKILPLRLSSKACIPFLDSMTSGYLILTTQDIMIDKNDEEFNMTWAADDKDMTTVIVRNTPVMQPTPNGYRKEHTVWSNVLMLKTPRGYSAIFTHPFNRYDLPFITASGIVDLDKSVMTTGKIPFYLKQGFTGLIPKGTPIVQVILFKRVKWLTVFDIKLFKQNLYALKAARLISMGYYKKFNWSKKIFN
jgi:hypothetical protein